MKLTRLSALLATASALAFSAMAGSALADTEKPVESGTAKEAATAAAAEPSASTGVQEIVVTGTLRTQRLQEVPLAVSSVAATEFERAGLKEPRELQFLSPSIQVSIQGGNSIVIRGSGTASQNSGTEQSVGMVIDGVLMGFVDDIGGDISDLDHIEVYRGPQGTQFAKNASSGVVSVTTKKPVIGNFSMGAHLTYGEHNDTSDNFHINVPINDTMAARFVAGFQHRDGVFENVVRNELQAAREQYSLKGKFLWRPRDRTSVYLSTDFRRESQSPNFPQAWYYCGPQGPTTAYVNTYGTRNLPPCNGALLAGITPSITNTQIVEEDDAWRHTAAGGASVQVDYPLGEFELTSISAFRFMSRHFHGPTGSGIKTNSFLNNIYGGPQYSQELRLASPPGKPLEYVAGAFIYRRSTRTKSWGIGPQYGLAKFLYPNTIYGSQVQVASAGGGVYSHNVAASKALFTDGTYHFTDQLLLAGGVRVTWDDNSAESVTKVLPGVFSSAGPNGKLKSPDSDKISATGWTYRIGPQFFFTPDVQMFGTFAHGYKGPLIDTSTDDFGRILPETVNAFEVGLKSSWFERRLIVNVTGFHQKFHNFQTTTLNTSVIPNVFQLGNAKGMLTKGVELEVTARPIRDLSLTAGGTYLDAKFTDYTLACYNGLEPIKQPVTTDPTGRGGCYTSPTGVKFTNADGFPLINASKWTVRLSASYNHRFDSGWAVDATANWLHRTGWWAAPTDPNIINKGYGVLNLNAGISPPGGAWRLGVFARNALDKFFTAGMQANNGGATIVLNPEAVRTIGVSLDIKFGE